jgi:tRNA-2-methylthio-N6-dimethylallyladenosine synthase
MKYHLWTIGCQMNEADSQRLASELERLGYQPTARAETADVIVLNTCVVRQSAEQRAYGRLSSLRPLKARRPETVIGLMGCLVGLRDPAPLRAQFPYVDVFLPPSDPAPLLELLRQRQLDQQAQTPDEAPSCLTSRNGGHDGASEAVALAEGHPLPDEGFVLPMADRGTLVAAYVPIIYGCNHVCAFCIVPYRRGRERSRPPAEVVAEVRRLVAQGVRQVTLLGQIVDRYGYDLIEQRAKSISRSQFGFVVRTCSALSGAQAPTTSQIRDLLSIEHGDVEQSPLVDLLRELNEVEGLYRIRFLASHPSYLRQDILDAVATLPQVCAHIEVPVQSGDDEVLQRMRRGYTVDEYRRLIAYIRERLPGAGIATDVIVGFPGESEEQFQHTYGLLEELELDMAHVAMFSPRPGTAAARWPDDVPLAEKKRRLLAINDLQACLASRINARLLGQTVEVLVEGQHRGKWQGRTRSNKLVFFTDQADWRGRLALVRVERTSPWSLQGTVVGG